MTGRVSRIGLVLGAGGAVGHAYHAGVLAALAESGWDPRAAEVVVGTSAGSIVAAYLRAGLSAPDLAAASLGRPLTAEGAALLSRHGRRDDLETPGPRHADLTGGPAAAELLLRPWGVRMGALAAALLPAGKVSTEPIESRVDAIYGDSWPEAPTWICAVCLEDGRLVAFGKPDAPPATMGLAVSASCAIPSYFQPVVIGGRRHVDGGSHSVTNADLLAGLGLDLVVVSCPMGGTREAIAMGWDLPLRGAVRARLAAEIRAVRRAGTPVLTLQPTRAARAAMGNNPMNATRAPAVTEAAWQATAERLRHDEVRERLAALA
jgi:NTE family protein